MVSTSVGRITSRRMLSGSGVNDVTAVVLMAAHFEMPVCPLGGGKGLCNPIRHFEIWDQAMALATCGESILEYIDLGIIYDSAIRPPSH